MAELSNSEIEDQKKRLEIKKLGLEVKELRRSFWKKPQWLGFLTTFIISLISAAFFISNGTFDKKYQQFKNEKALLELNVKEFALKKNLLEDSLKQMKDTLNKRKKELLLLEKQQNGLKGINQRLSDDIGSQNIIISDLRKELSKIEVDLLDTTFKLNTKLYEKGFQASSYHENSLITNNQLRECQDRLMRNIDEIDRLQKLLNECKKN